MLFQALFFTPKDQDSILEINRILNEGKNSNINKACIQLAGHQRFTPTQERAERQSTKPTQKVAANR